MWHCVLPFSPTKGRDQVNTSIKFGSQYGCGEQLNCRMFMTLFSYFSTAAIGAQSELEITHVHTHTHTHTQKVMR